MLTEKRIIVTDNKGNVIFEKGLPKQLEELEKSLNKEARERLAERMKKAYEKAMDGIICYGNRS